LVGQIAKSSACNGRGYDQIETSYFWYVCFDGTPMKICFEAPGAWIKTGVGRDRSDTCAKTRHSYCCDYFRDYITWTVVSRSETHELLPPCVDGPWPSAWESSFPFSGERLFESRSLEELVSSSGEESQ